MLRNKEEDTFRTNNAEKVSQRACIGKILARRTANDNPLAAFTQNSSFLEFEAIVE